MVDDLIYGKLMDSLYPKSFLMTDEDGLQHEVIHYGDVKNAIEDFRIELRKRVGVSKMENVGDTIYRQDAIDALDCISGVEEVLRSLPSAQPEPLTDAEQRIFLAAMSREKEVCKEVDCQFSYAREPYEDTLVRVCGEIKRKVKAALWTN